MIMKKMKLFIIATTAIAVLFSGCQSASNTTKGTAIGAGAGAAVGAGLGAIIGGGKGAAWGAGIGAAVGAGSGAIIGKKMDKQKAELEQINNAQVESINDGQALKVTFESGILFATNSSTLTSAAQGSLNKFAVSLKNNPDTDVQIQGYTDSTGNDNINVPLSENRAKSVYNFLVTDGVNPSRMNYYGRGASNPVASNETVQGRAENRRVEVYIIPNAKMISDANQGR